MGVSLDGGAYKQYGVQGGVLLLSMASAAHQARAM